MDMVDTLDVMKSSASSTSTPHEDNINVVVRVRPLNEKELRAKDESITEFPGNGQILVSSTHFGLIYCVDTIDEIDIECVKEPIIKNHSLPIYF
jgi:hypothetical protein